MIVARKCGHKRTYQPAVVAIEPAAGSDPATGRVAYEIVELVGMEVASFQMATSLSRVELEKLG